MATSFWDDSKTVAEAQKMVDEKKSMMGIGGKELDLRMQERGQ